MPFKMRVTFGGTIFNSRVLHVQHCSIKLFYTNQVAKTHRIPSRMLIIQQKKKTLACLENTESAF